MEMRKVEVRMNKPIYLGQAILDISETLMLKFWYDYIVLKYVMYIKTDDFYKDMSNHVDYWFHTSILIEMIIDL